MLGASIESPRSPVAPVYVVRNTFVEVIDDNLGEPVEEEVSVPSFRRRRGSSFFRSSSEPLTGGRSARRDDQKEDVQGEATSTEDEGSEGISTPEVLSPATSRAASPAPGSRSPMYAGLPHFQMHSQQTVLSAAMYAGFNAGVHTAMAMKDQQPQQHMPLGQVPFGSQGGNMGQMPFFFEARNPPFALPKYHEQSLPVRARESSPVGQHSSNSSDAGTVVSAAKQPCHFIWCDHRAFKDTSSTLKTQLEKSAGATVKTHKTAENCIRLFRKKQRAQGRPPCVILVSWANAPALLSYLAEADHVSARVIVLCDARSCRKNESADQLAAQFPFIDKIATTWDEAVESACNVVAAFN